MPSTPKRVTAKQKANLKRGGSPGRPKLTAEDREVRKLSKKLLGDPKYLKTLRERLESGRIQPGVEAMLWYYAFGKPPETVEQKVVTPVRIQHNYAEDK